MSIFGNISHGLTHPLQGGLGFLTSGGNQGGALKSLFDQMQRQQALRGVQSLGYQQQGLRAINSGFDQAIGNVGSTGLASKMGIESAGSQTQANIGQNLANRGLSNTTVGANLGGLAQGQTAQALAGVDQAVANAKAGLLTQKGLAQNSAYGGLSGLMQQLGGQEQNLGMTAWQRMASQPTQEQQLMQFFGSLGNLLPMLGGMGGGGTAAAMAANGAGRGVINMQPRQNTYGYGDGVDYYDSGNQYA